MGDKRAGMTRFGRKVRALSLCLMVAAGAVLAFPASADASASGSNSAVGYGAASVVPPGLPTPGASVVGIAATPDGGGYWLVASDGGVFSFGDARFWGSLGGYRLNQPVVGIAATPDGGGYWLVASDGGIFSFGDARFFGSTGSISLNQPVVGIAATPDGGGYWLVASDGGIFSFGDARFFGSMGAIALNQPVVGIAATHDGGGYWLVASDGGIFSFGDARFFGSTGSIRLNQPIVGMAASSDGGGYWLVARDGGIFTFGDAQFYGSGAGSPSPSVAVGMASRAGGYWIAYGREPSPFGPQMQAYAASRGDNVTAALFDANTGQVFLYRPGVQEATASIVKVDILATLLSQAQAAGRTLTSGEMSLATAMITQSDNNAATALWDEIGAWPAMAVFNAGIPMPGTAMAADGGWRLTQTTPLDQVNLLRHLVFPNAVLTDASRAYEVNLMENVIPSQAWGVSGGVPAGVTVALKNGWLPVPAGGPWQVNSIGYVSGQGRSYAIAVMTNGNPSEDYGIQTIQQISSDAWQALG